MLLISFAWAWSSCDAIHSRGLLELESLLQINQYLAVKSVTDVNCLSVSPGKTIVSCAASHRYGIFI